MNKCYVMFYMICTELQQRVDSCKTSYINDTFIMHLYCVDLYFNSCFVSVLKYHDFKMLVIINSLLITQTLISAHVLLMCYFVMTLLEAHYH